MRIKMINIIWFKLINKLNAFVNYAAVVTDELFLGKHRCPRPKIKG